MNVKPEQVMLPTLSATEGLVHGAGNQEHRKMELIKNIDMEEI